MRGNRIIPNQLKHNIDRAEDRFRAVLFRLRFPLFLLGVTALAVWGRVALWPFASGDFVECLDPWMNEIRAGRGFHSIGTQVGNYTAPYHYLMALMSYIPGLDNLLAIKIPSAIADFCMAATAGLLVWRLCGEKWKAALCYALVLFLPSVWLNSGMWGQCDAMYTTFILLFLCLYLAEKPAVAVLFYGLALSIKLQAIFVLPAVLILWLCGRLRLRHLLAGAAGYVLPFIPAMLAAGSFSPLWRAYAMQTKVSSFSSNIPNLASLFTGIEEADLPLLTPALMAACFIALGALAFVCWQHRERLAHPRAVVTLVALCALAVPFLLPAMKDRYYFVAEVLLVVCAVVTPRRFWAPVSMQLAILPSYTFYLFAGENPFGRFTVLMAMAPIAALAQDLFTVTTAPPAKPLKAGTTKPDALRPEGAQP